MSTDEKLIEMENSLEEMNRKIDEVLNCLKGNDMGVTGLVKEFATLKSKVYRMEEESLKSRTEAKIYLVAIKFLGGIIVSLVIGYIWSQIINK